MDPLLLRPHRLVLLALLLGATGAHAARITRGPFLQLASPDGITVVWRTDAPGVGGVRFGPSSGELSSASVEPAPSTTHVVRLEGLQPATRYRYALELDGQPLLSGPDLTFRTYPPRGTPEPFRFFAWGDSGTGEPPQLALADRMASQVGEPAFSLHLGDIIYPAGEAENYDPHYFRPYAPLLRRHVIWPTIGNHEVMTANGQPYLDAYYLPTNNPAGSELYYSFDYGDAHFVSLATDRESFAPGSPQLEWAKEDLAKSEARWKFVFFHRPPYTGGTHTGDERVQAAIVPLLEKAGVDVVFAGHSHVYERTYLLQNEVVLQADKGSYTKLPGSPGTLYVVSGAGGKSGTLHNPFHSLMAVQKGRTVGTLVVDVEGLVARGYFLHPDGDTLDLFTLYKDKDATAPATIGVRAGPGAERVTLSFNEPVRGGASPGGAEDPARYTISPPVPVKSAKLGPDLRTVVLETGPHQAGTYALAVSGVQDRAEPPNVLAAGTSVSYAYDPNAPVAAGVVGLEATDARAAVGGSRRTAPWLLGAPVILIILVVLWRRRRKA